MLDIVEFRMASSLLGLMDKASDFKSEDCGFESRRRCFSFVHLQHTIQIVPFEADQHVLHYCSPCCVPHHYAEAHITEHSANPKNHSPVIAL